VRGGGSAEGKASTRGSRRSRSSRNETTSWRAIAATVHHQLQRRVHAVLRTPAVPRSASLDAVQYGGYERPGCCACWRPRIPSIPRMLRVSPLGSAAACSGVSSLESDDAVDGWPGRASPVKVSFDSCTPANTSCLAGQSTAGRHGRYIVVGKTALARHRAPAPLFPPYTQLQINYPIRPRATTTTATATATATTATINTCFSSALVLPPE
jgi:hypothetical protein